MLSAPRGPLRGCRKQNLPSRKAVRVVCVETGLALRRRAEEAEMGFPTACVTQGSSNKAPGSFGVHQGPRGAFGEPKKWQERWSSRSPMRHQKSSTPHLLHGDFCIKFHSKVSRSEQDILADECPGSSGDKETRTLEPAPVMGGETAALGLPDLGPVPWGRPRLKPQVTWASPSSHPDMPWSFAPSHCQVPNICCPRLFILFLPLHGTLSSP